MKERIRTGRIALIAFVVGTVAAAVLLLGGPRVPRRVWSPAALDPVPASSAAADSTPWHLAAQSVTEDRGEATGRQAKVEVPSQLRHYSDTRRFLAIQVAEWKEHSVETPHDYAGLAGMIRGSELVEVPAATDSYVLYGVGALADQGPFTHYDKSAKGSVVILDEAELESERARLEESAARAREEIVSLKTEADSLDKTERSRRASLRAQAAKKEKALKAELDAAELLDSSYGKPDRRQSLFAERDALASLAVDFHGHKYDLGDARSRREMKVRMLSHLRPAALAVMKELAASYNTRFGRPLPITSLVRPDEYQHRLSRSNSNATRIEVPPHSTGLAFDILYRYMTAEEQEHVMADIARLRDEGRVESLRENRDHFHVFAFMDGRRPAEDLIAEYLGHSAKAGRQEESEPAERPEKKAVRAEGKQAAKKEPVKKAGREAEKPAAAARNGAPKKATGRQSARKRK
ncbi:MAG TPA: DUF5715 family protein [Pyrinomonadaceae bacterium]|nr:DUF5715 family protein [Pyrinomonadaceae bacterium]